MSIGIDSLNSIYNSEYLSQTSQVSKLESTLSTDLTTVADDELMDVCKDFESYFTEQVFKSMKKMIPENEETSGTASGHLDYFEDLLYQEYAKAQTEGEGLGIAQMLYEQMKRNYNL